MTKVPINDPGRTFGFHAERLLQESRSVLESGVWLNGPKSAAFCAAFAEELGVAHCIGVGNGTDALEIGIRALLALDDRFSDRPTDRARPAPEIVTVANAGGYTTAVCHLIGCVPVYADIEVDSQLLSIPSALASLGDATAAVVVTHLYGGLVDVPLLREAMDRAGFAHVPILEDGSQAHGLSGCGGEAGAFGKVAAFSFYPTKNLGAMGDAGVIVTNDDECAALIRELRQYGWSEKYQVARPYGRNSRLDEIQAALLLTLLPSLDAANRRRRAILDSYAVALPEPARFARSADGTVGHLAVVLTDHRDGLRAHLEARGVATDIHYPVLDCHQASWRRLPHRIGPDGLRISQQSVQRILTVPCFPLMTDEEIDVVGNALADFGKEDQE